MKVKLKPNLFREENKMVREIPEGAKREIFWPTKAEKRKARKEARILTDQFVEDAKLHGVAHEIGAGNLTKLDKTHYHHLLSQSLIEGRGLWKTPRWWIFLLVCAWDEFQSFRAHLKFERDLEQRREKERSLQKSMTSKFKWE